MSTMDTVFNLKEVLYSILFVAGDGIEKSFIAEKLNVSEKELNKAIDELKNELSGEKGIHLIEYKNKIQLASNPNYANYISDVLNPIREKSLTRAALETLAIIAYNEPITRTGVDNLRGISSSFMIKKLMAKDLIKVCGKSDLPGHPNLYKTTREFLDYFGLASLSDLPEIKFNKENSNEEVDLYKSTYKEN